MRVIVSPRDITRLKILPGPQLYVPSRPLIKDGMINGAGRLFLAKGLPFPSSSERDIRLPLKNHLAEPNATLSTIHKQYSIKFSVPYDTVPPEVVRVGRFVEIMAQLEVPFGLSIC